jgi:hypothetical protein
VSNRKRESNNLGTKSNNFTPLSYFTYWCCIVHRLGFQNVIKLNFRLKNHTSTCNKQRLLRTTTNRVDLQKYTPKPNFTEPKQNFSEKGNQSNPRTSGITTMGTFKPYYLQSYLITNPIKMHKMERDVMSLII